MVRFEPASVPSGKFEAAAAQAHGTALQSESIRPAGRRRHRVADQKHLAARLGGERDFERQRIDVMAIGDDAAPDVCIGKCGADHSRLARGRGLMALKRWVKPRAPAASAACASAAVASAWPSETMMPASVSARMIRAKPSTAPA